MTSESTVESHLRKRVRKVGGRAFKLLPSTAGLPDRLVVLPPGRIFLVELKRPGGSTQLVQDVMHRKLEHIGIDVPVLSSKEEVDEWLDHIGESE
jgi:hypothetical protein